MSMTLAEVIADQVLEGVLEEHINLDGLVKIIRAGLAITRTEFHVEDRRILEARKLIADYDMFRDPKWGMPPDVDRRKV